MPRRIHKKNLIVSYNNLSEELKELFKETYPEGYKDYLQKTIKPNGEPIFVVPIETEDSVYMVKFDVKIDTGLVEEDLDKDLYGEEKTEEGDFAPMSEAIDREEGESNKVGPLKHGAYEEIFSSNTKKEFEVAAADIEAEFGNQDDDDFDNYVDDDPDADKDDDDTDDEPNDDELMDLENDDFMAEVLGDDPMTTEVKKKRGRPRVNESVENLTEQSKSSSKTAKEPKPRRARKSAQGEK